MQSPLAFLSAMTEAEKAVYLQQENNDECSASSTPARAPPLSASDRRLQNRFSAFLERLQLLSGTYFTLKPDLYQLNDCMNIVGTTLFTSLDHLPDFRLRNVIRNCFLPFVRHCPVNGTLIAVLEPLLPFMYTKLKDKWRVIADRQSIKLTNGTVQESSENDHQTQDRCEEEVIEEQVRVCFHCQSDIRKRRFSRSRSPAISRATLSI